MPAYGRDAIESSNLIPVENLPRMPVPLYYGKVSWSDSFEGMPSATVDYLGVTESDLPRLESAYSSLSASITISNIPFVVTSYGYKREPATHKGRIVNTYQVQIGLESKWKDGLEKTIYLQNLVVNSQGRVDIGQLANAAGVPYFGPYFDFAIEQDSYTLNQVLQDNARRLGCFISYTEPNGVALKPFNSSNNWYFPTEQVISDGQNTVQKPPKLNRAELRGNFLTNTPATATGSEKKEIKPEEVVEGSDDPELPPAGTLVLWGLDSNFDKGGPTKQRKTTTTLDSTTLSEKLETFAFMYTAEEINIGDGEPFTTTPEDFWGLAEYLETEYIYEELSLATIQAIATDPVTGQFLPIVVHPDSEYLTRNSGGTPDSAGSNQGGVIGPGASFGPAVMSLSSTVQYLTAIKRRGWKMVRLQQETDGYETLFPEDPYYPFYKYVKTPKEETTLYLLKSSREVYGDTVGLPFSVAWQSFNELDPRIQTKHPSLRYYPKTAVLSFDPNFVEPYFVKTESTVGSSLHYQPDPESTIENPRPPKIAGEESIFELDRTLLSKKYDPKKETDPTIKNEATQKFREYIKEYRSQDAGFSSANETVRFRQVLGRPPDSTSMKKSWQDAQQTQSNNTIQTSKRYFVTSDQVVRGIDPEGGTLDYTTAQTVNEALTAATIDLRIAGMQVSQASKTIAWHYPQIKAGDLITVGSDRFSNKGDWRVTQVSWSIDFNGMNNRFSKILATSQGTQLSLGLDLPRSVFVEEEQGGLSNGDGKLQIEYLFTEKELGDITPNMQTRRNF